MAKKMEMQPSKAAGLRYLAVPFAHRSQILKQNHSLQHAMDLDGNIDMPRAQAVEVWCLQPQPLAGGG